MADEKHEISGIAAWIDSQLLRWLWWLAIAFFIARIVGWFIFPDVIGRLTLIVLICVLIPGAVTLGARYIANAHQTGSVRMSFGLETRTVNRSVDPMLYNLCVGSYWIGTGFLAVFWVGLISGAIQI